MVDWRNKLATEDILVLDWNISMRQNLHHLHVDIFYNMAAFVLDQQ